VKELSSFDAIMKKKEYPLVIYSTDKHADIVYGEIRHTLRIDVSIAREIVESRLDFTQNEKHYLIADVSKVTGVTAEAKEYFQRPAAGLKNILGAAFIGSSPVAVLIANIFIKTRKEFQSKIFTNKHDAFLWIYEYKLKMEQQVTLKSGDNNLT
jgi:hypothetical protein